MDRKGSALERLQEANLELVELDLEVRRLVREEEEVQRKRDSLRKQVQWLFIQAEKEVNGE